MSSITHFIKKLFSKISGVTVIRGNIAVLTLVQSPDDDAGFYGSYKIVGGKVRIIKRINRRVLIPITGKVTIIYTQVGSEGGSFRGKTLDKYKIILYKNYVGKKKVIRL